MTVGDCLHGVAQPMLVERAGDGDVQLHHVQVVLGTLRGAAVEDQPLLQCGQRQDVGDPVLPRQLVDLMLGEAGGRDVRRSESTPAVSDVFADAGQRVQPQPAEPIDLCVI